MTKNQYLLKNSTYLAIGSLGTKLINFFLVPYYTYVLSSEEYGTIDLLFTLCTLIIPVVICNINEAVMRFLMDKDTNDNEVGSVAFVFLLIGSISTLFLVLIFKKINVTNAYAWHLYFFIIISGIHNVVFYYLRGREQLLKYSICNILNTLLIAILNIYFLTILHAGVNGYFKAYSISFAISSLIAFFWGKEYEVLGNFYFKPDLGRKMFTFSIALVPNSLLWWLINSSDRVMVSSISGLSANGLYGVAYKIPSLLTTLSQIFMQAWTYSSIREKQNNSDEQYTNYIYDNLFSVMSLVSCTLLVFNKFIFKILFARNYFEANQYAVPLIMGFFFLTMATFIGTTYYVEKNTVGTMFSALVGASLNIVLNILLIPHWGPYGAAIATALSYVVIYIYRAIDTHKYINLHVFKPQYGITLSVMAALMVINYVDNSLISIFSIIMECIILFLNRKFIFACVHMLKRYKT